MVIVKMTIVCKIWSGLLFLIIRFLTLTVVRHENESLMSKPFNELGMTDENQHP